MPTTTTTATIHNLTFVLGPGGTPLYAPLPTGVTLVSAITPTRSKNDILFITVSYSLLS
ncbi:hypothetical protein B0H10DRAFT_2013876 [Mycena sp. CBHHK59/15]|nr:hypothetical protein B0H10DRAFT_2013876 [Mycena sp. CBHHK59/15]